VTGRAPKDIFGAECGYVYLAYNPASGLHKIGAARRPLTRLTQLCREMCARVALLHTIATNAVTRLEREVQARFLASHTGGEWFLLDHAQVAVIQSVSSVFYNDAGQWRPRSNSRIDFDAGAAWAKRLPICGHYSGDQ
jgi:hypothetical protein